MNPASDDDVFESAARLGSRLVERGLTVTTVESCTGGLIARALTETAGSSQWFEQGLVTYGNGAKVRLAGVAARTLEDHGAVSAEVALEMALGGLRSAGADVALSVTGIAGPGGAVPGKPVGTVWFAWALRSGLASHDGLTRVEARLLTGNRAQIRRQAAHHALQTASLMVESIRY